MRITDNLTMTKRTSDGAFYGERNSKTYVIKSVDANYDVYACFYETMRGVPYSSRPEYVNRLKEQGAFPVILNEDEHEHENEAGTPAEDAPSAKEILMGGIRKLMDFFSEFAFTPSFRFTNTFAYKCCESQKSAREYVSNYFALMDSSYQKEVSEKLKSGEFRSIVKDIAQYGAPTNHINSRLKIYFGSAGTGKTTLAQQESDNRCIVCNSSMLPSDLMEDFIFKDGNPDFNPSLLWECMEKGQIIVLDEINLLPFDSLRFLQGIADGKTEFYYKNRAVHINEGFQIIGTMNLSLGGMTYGLPEPLVDRCADTREFVLSAEQLAKAIIGQEEGE